MDPQCVIRLEEEDDDPDDGEAGCSFVVGLIQKNRRRMRKMGEDMHTIGFAIYEVPDEFSGQRNVHLDRNFFLRHASAARSETFINLGGLQPLRPASRGVPHHPVHLPAQRGRRLLRPGLLRETSRLPSTGGPGGVAGGEDQNPRRRRGRAIQASVWTAGGTGSDIRTSGFSLDTCRNMVNLLDKDSSGKLGLVEFKILWTKIENFLKIYRNRDADNSGTMSSAEMRTAVDEAGFSLNSPLHQVLVARYSEPDLTVDFDNFVSCLVRLETMFDVFAGLDKDGSGTVELGLTEWLNTSLL